VPRTGMAAIIAEYRYLAQSIASQYGHRHENFTGDGHLFLFETADVALHFGLKLIAFWKQRRQSLLAAYQNLDIALRVGCHFGECQPLSDGDAWIGRAINLAKQVESSAASDTLFVTQSILDLVDLPFYEFEEAGQHPLKGDYFVQRQLYRVISVDESALSERPFEELTAGDWFLKGVGLVGSERENTAEEAECYRQALRLRPNYPEAHNNLAILLKTIGDISAAAEHYEEALRLWPQYAEAHYNYAILLETTNDPQSAVDHYREALRCRPTYTDAHHRYANLLTGLGDAAEADRHYREALRLRPGDAEAHNNYAILLEREHQLAAAERHYKEALRLRPDYAEGHYNYAIFLEGRDQVGKAEEHYRTAVQISRDYAEAHNNLAVLLHGKGDLCDAEKHYSEALRLRPDDPETNYNFALLMQAKGNMDAAEKHFRRARELAAQMTSFRTISRPK